MRRLDSFIYAHLNILSDYVRFEVGWVTVTEIWPRCHKGNVENEEAQKPNKEWHTTEPQEGHSVPPGDLQVQDTHRMKFQSWIQVIKCIVIS